MDLQQRPSQHGHRRHHARYETEPIPNGRVTLVSNSPTNGGITHGANGTPYSLRRGFDGHAWSGDPNEERLHSAFGRKTPAALIKLPNAYIQSV
jgi:hypothetical protein